MVTVLFLQAWGAHEAQTIAEVSESQAEPLMATGVAVRVDLTPNVFDQPEPEVEAPPPVKLARPARKSA